MLVEGEDVGEHPYLGHVGRFAGKHEYFVDRTKPTVRAVVKE